MIKKKYISGAEKEKKKIPFLFPPKKKYVVFILPVQKKKWMKNTSMAPKNKRKKFPSLPPIKKKIRVLFTCPAKRERKNKCQPHEKKTWKIIACEKEVYDRYFFPRVELHHWRKTAKKKDARETEEEETTTKMTYV